jgi:two-component system OmpR family response regulator
MTARAPLILVVDDDRSIREALCEYLEQWGFSVRAAASGAEADAVIAGEPPDAIVLDIMMPGEDGLALCKRLKGRFPVLMLSALGSSADRILGLELGADDYLPKPFDPRELVARLRAVMRRRESPSGAGEAGALMVFDGWSLHEAARELVDATGAPVALTGGEFDLLLAFASRPQRILSRQLLLQLTQGPLSESYDRAVDLTVSRLRRKLRARGGDHLVQTVWGEGYRFTVPVQRRQLR